MVGAGRDLPASISSFVGRQAEIDSLHRVLAENRLVSVLGPGGAGKTRLVLETLRRHSVVERYAYVSVEPLRTPAQLAAAVAASIGLRDPMQTVADDAVRSALGEDTVLLVLDGAELIAAEAARLVRRLLAAAARLRILTTTRRLLDVPGEVTWRMPELSSVTCGGGAADRERDAVALFLTRARERVRDFDPDLDVVRELCRRLNGLPLAIELMAGWTGTLTVEQILQGRADLLSSDGVMHGVLHRSFELLDGPEQELLTTLSVFSSDFSLDDARSVSGVPPRVFASGLRALVNTSWVNVHDVASERRYAMPEVVREFGAAQRTKAGRDQAVLLRHAEFYADVAVESESGLAGTQAATWRRRMRAIDADLQDALRWAQQTNALDVRLRLAGSLWRWWLLSGQMVTGRNWLNDTIAASKDRSDVFVGRALTGGAILAAESNDPTSAAAQARQAFAILDTVDPPGAARAVTIHASALRYLGKEREARERFETALRIWREVGDLRGESSALNNLALLSLDSADLDEASRLLTAALEIKRRLGERRSIALSLCNLSEVLVRTRRLDAAEHTIAEANDLTELSDLQLRGGLLCNAGDLAARRAQWNAARGFYTDAIALHQQAGNEHDVIVARVGLGRAVHHLGDTSAALEQLHQAEQSAARADNQQRLMFVRVALGEISGKRSAPRQVAGVTARQAEILVHVMAGQTNREIGESLHITEATVERHLATVYRNKGLANRTAAARFAMDHGL